MAKNKLAKWAELSQFKNVIEPDNDGPPGRDHRIKGNWNSVIFGNNNPITLELGCGKGEYTTGLASFYPEKNFIGVDIKGARMWRGAKTANEKELRNAAFLRTRIEFINNFFGPDEVDAIWLTFPDPYPGKSNSNKRLTCPWFLNKYRNLLINKGIVCLKTDNRELFDYTRKIALANNLEIIFETQDLYSEAGLEVKDDSSQGSINRFLNEHAGVLSIKTYYEHMFIQKKLRIHFLAFILDKDVIKSNGQQ